jgi:hypothetical protein
MASRSGHIYLGLLLSELASVAALQNNRESALDLLAQAVERGWSDDALRDNPHFASLHGDPGFERIVAGFTAEGPGDNEGSL